MVASGIQLIAGLGNPGPDYSQTRHNAGAWFVEQLAAQHNTSLHLHAKFQGLSGKIIVDDVVCHLLIPTTYMNLSGQAVATLAHFFKLAPEHILIVHDELDLEPGVARLKFGGGHAGHNGLRNIFDTLSSADFYRLRLGIGRPAAEDVADYVVKRPNKHDRELIEQSIARSLTLVPELVAGRFEQAMQILHTDV